MLIRWRETISIRGTLSVSSWISSSSDSLREAVRFVGGLIVDDGRGCDLMVLELDDADCVELKAERGRLLLLEISMYLVDGFCGTIYADGELVPFVVCRSKPNGLAGGSSGD